MGDVEDMIGQLEEEEDEEEPGSAEEDEDEEEESTAFGLNLDKAWSSPDREE